MKTGYFFLFSYLFLLPYISTAQNQHCFEYCWDYLEEVTRTGDYADFRFPYQKVMTSLEGCPMPAFEYKTLDGYYLVPESLRGKIVVMNFWFYSCTPCRNELPGLNKLADYFAGKDVIFIAIGRDRAESIREFLKKNEFRFIHVPDSFSIGAHDLFCIMGGLPTTLVFDRRGLLISSVRGGSVDPAKRFEIFDTLRPILEDALSHNR